MPASARLGSLLLLASLTTTACWDDDAPPPPPELPPPATLTRVDTVAPGAECPNGGTAVRVGADRNRDGTLDPSEVQTSQDQCRQSYVVDTGDEPAGAHCASGGTVIRSGDDRDGNGVLERDEVLATRYVCSAIIEGDVAIADADDLRALVGIGAITGSLTITGEHLGAIDLPALRFVGGAITARSVAGLTALRLPALESARSIDVEDAPALTEVAAPALTQCGDVLALRNPAMTALRLPALARVTSLVVEAPLQTLVLDALSTADRVSLQGVAAAAIDLPSLVGVGGLYVEDTTSRTLSAPLLERATTLWVTGNPALTGLALDRMGVIGDLVIRADDVLEQLGLPHLYYVSSYFDISSNPALTAIDLANTHVNYAFIVNDQALQRAAFEIDYGALTVEGTPKLTTLNVTMRDAAFVYMEQVGLTSLELKGLKTAGSFQIQDAPDLTSLKLPSLQSTGKLLLDHAPALTTLSVPALRQVTDTVSLVSLGLSTCAAEAILARLEVTPIYEELKDLGDHACP